MLGLQDVHVARLSPDPVVFKTPAGAQIGQRFKVVTVRSQLAF
jgi:phosphate-selective porin OprO/OprP